MRDLEAAIGLEGSPRLGLRSILHKFEEVSCSSERIRGDGDYWWKGRGD